MPHPLHRLWNSAYPLLTLVSLLWAGNSIVGRALSGQIPPLGLAGLRWTIALSLLLPFAWQPLKRDLPAIRVHWRPLLLLGVLGIGSFNALLYSGLQYTSATNALLMQSAQTPLILLLGALLFREPVTARQTGGVILSIAGVAAVVTGGHPGSLFRLGFNHGDLIVLAAVCVWSLYTALLRWRPPINPVSFVAATFVIGVGCTVPLALFELWRGAHYVLTPGTIAGIGYVAIFPSLISYLLYNRAVDLIGGPRAGQFLNLMPLFGAGLAVLLLGEPLGGHHFVGMALILAGIAVFGGARPAKTAAPAR